MHADLTIDRNVRDWVFFPLMIAIVLMNMLRQYAHQVRPFVPVLYDADNEHNSIWKLANTDSICCST